MAKSRSSTGKTLGALEAKTVPATTNITLPLVVSSSRRKGVRKDPQDLLKRPAKRFRALVEHAAIRRKMGGIATLENIRIYKKQQAEKHAGSRLIKTQLPYRPTAPLPPTVFNEPPQLTGARKLPSTTASSGTTLSGTGAASSSSAPAASGILAPKPIRPIGKIKLRL